MAEIQIRHAEPADWPAMRDLTLAAYDQYAAVMSPDGWTYYQQDIVETIADPESPAERIVAAVDGAIVGSVLLYPARPIADEASSDGLSNNGLPAVRLLAVHPAARGQGIGRALIEACLRRARRAGARGLSLHTTDMMQVAVRLYEQMGFVRAPETDWAPAPGYLIKGYRRSLADIELGV